MRKYAGVPVEERGSAFFVIAILAMATTALVGAYLTTSLGKVRHVSRSAAESTAFQAAESGLNAAIQKIWTLYRQSPESSRFDALDVLDGKRSEPDRFRIEDRNENGVLDDFDYPGGYDGESERFPAQAGLEMPYLGDLSTYRLLATARGGKISQGGTVLIDGVMGDGPDEDPDVILVGTEEDPIVVEGPVVVNGDVVLRGVITGRGTIYAGRNVHIVGDLTYASPPEWQKPMTDRDGVSAANRNRDLVGLAAKGSIVLGDYTEDWWKSATGYYQRPPFTQPYAVDATDATNGYVSYYDAEGVPIFDGDYTDLDGGTKASDDGLGTVSRRFYESSFSDAEVHDTAEGGYLRRVDAVLYTNHLLSGRIGESAFHGTLVCRDEAIIYSGSLTMDYDVRIRGDGYEYIDIFLPREPTYRVLFWSEGSP